MERDVTSSRGTQREGKEAEEKKGKNTFTYRHGQQPGAIMFQGEILVVKRLGAIDADAAGTITMQEIPALDHEVFNLVFFSISKPFASRDISITG